MIYYAHDYEQWEDTDDPEWWVDFTPENKEEIELTFKDQDDFYLWWCSN